MTRKEFFRSRWFVGITASIIGSAFFTLITSLVKNQKIIITLVNGIAYISNIVIKILFLEIKVYHLLFVLISSIIIKKIKKPDEIVDDVEIQTSNSNHGSNIKAVESGIKTLEKELIKEMPFYDYRSDKFPGNLRWTWDYDINVSAGSSKAATDGQLKTGHFQHHYSIDNSYFSSISEMAF